MLQNLTGESCPGKVGYSGGSGIPIFAVGVSRVRSQPARTDSIPVQSLAALAASQSAVPATRRVPAGMHFCFTAAGRQVVAKFAEALVRVLQRGHGLSLGRIAIVRLVGIRAMIGR